MQNNSVVLREEARHYIAASDSDLSAMLKAVGKDSLEELFEHIPSAVKFTETLNLADELEYVELKEKLAEISKRNRILERAP